MSWFRKHTLDFLLFMTSTLPHFTHIHCYAATLINTLYNSATLINILYNVATLINTLYNGATLINTSPVHTPVESRQWLTRNHQLSTYNYTHSLISNAASHTPLYSLVLQHHHIDNTLPSSASPVTLPQHSTIHWNTNGSSTQFLRCFLCDRKEI